MSLCHLQQSSNFMRRLLGQHFDILVNVCAQFYAVCYNFDLFLIFTIWRIIEAVFKGWPDPYCTKIEFSFGIKTFSNEIVHLYQDSSYGEILAGQPGAWLVKKYVLYGCNQKFSKRTSY